MRVTPAKIFVDPFVADIVEGAVVAHLVLLLLAVQLYKVGKRQIFSSRRPID